MTTISDKDRADAQALFEEVEDCGSLAPLSDGGVRRWLAIRDHVLAAHECPTVPVWRPVIDGEDLTGHEVRARSNDADWWAAWGVAFRRNLYGNWVTKGGAVLTGGWSVTETTAPKPEPEPDQRVGLLEGVCLREGVVLTRSDAALLLSIADAAEHLKAGA